MNHLRFPLLLAVLLCMMGSLSAQSGITVSSWRMHKGQGPIPVTSIPGFSGSELPENGHEIAYKLKQIPPSADSGWSTAKLDENGQVFLSESSTIPCLKQVDFTYFESTIKVSPNAQIRALTLNFVKADDGARIFIFNSDHPDGITPENGTLVWGEMNEDNAIDLAPHIVRGASNRVVVVQFDDCADRNEVQGIQIKADGVLVAPKPDPTLPGGMLYAFYDVAKTDNYALLKHDPKYNRKKDYDFPEGEGCLLGDADVAGLPADAYRPLDLTYAADRTDYMLISNPVTRKDNPNYVDVERLGYVYTSKRPGTRPLQQYWFSRRTDNYTVALPRGEAGAKSTGYKFIRTEGYLPQDCAARLIGRTFRIKTVSDNGAFNYLGIAETDKGKRPARLGMYAKNNSKTQLWEMEDAGNGNYKFKSTIGGANVYMDADYPGLDRNGSPAQLWSGTNGANQAWKLTEQSDGSYIITTVDQKGNNRVLDVAQGSSRGKMGGVVHLWDNNRTANQKWIIEPIMPAPKVKIVAASFGLNNDFREVTSNVQGVVDDQGPAFRILRGTVAPGRDPAVGKQKQLKLTFVVDGMEYTATFMEGTNVDLLDYASKNTGTPVAGAAPASLVYQHDQEITMNAAADGKSVTEKLPSSYTKAVWVNIVPNSNARNNLISGKSNWQHAFWVPNIYQYRLAAGHNGKWDAVRSPDPLSTGWHHVAVTYDPASTTMTLYLDGNEVGKNTGVPQVKGNIQGFMQVGRYDNGNELKGKIKELRVFDGVLSGQQINELMQRTR